MMDSRCATWCPTTNGTTRPTSRTTRDGHNGNLSWNCGAEGPTDDAAVNAAAQATDAQSIGHVCSSRRACRCCRPATSSRARSAATTMPIARTTRFRGSTGICAASIMPLLRFVQLLAQLRRRHVEFRRETFLKGAASRAGVKDVTWLNVRGIEMTHSEWQDEHLRTLGIWFGKRRHGRGTPVAAAECRRICTNIRSACPSAAMGPGSVYSTPRSTSLAAVQPRTCEGLRTGRQQRRAPGVLKSWTAL